MTWLMPETRRTDPPSVSDERTSLDAWLDYHRATLLHKCAGLSAEQLVARPIASSALSLLGIVRHLAECERWWFRRNFDARTELGDIFCTETDLDGDFDLVDAENAEADVETFREECAAARATTAGRSLDETFVFVRHPETMDLRWAYIHMIEEYARHNGHADLLRELIDGTTGE